MMKRATAVCLCLLMICSCALAQESVNLGGEGCDQMKYVCTLSDGRLVFCGNRGTVGNFNDARARLLCLNPDWTVSWEYIDPAKGMARYAFGALLEDGNIGIIYYNAPSQNTTALEIRKFTQEGRPVGEPIDLFQRSGSFFVRLFLNVQSGLCGGWIVRTDIGGRLFGFFFGGWFHV